jgi:hypothetical protein
MEASNAATSGLDMLSFGDDIDGCLPPSSKRHGKPRDASGTEPVTSAVSQSGYDEFLLDLQEALGLSGVDLPANAGSLQADVEALLSADGMAAVSDIAATHKQRFPEHYPEVNLDSDVDDVSDEDILEEIEELCSGSIHANADEGCATTSTTLEVHRSDNEVGGYDQPSSSSSSSSTSGQIGSINQHGQCQRKLATTHTNNTSGVLLYVSACENSITTRCGSISAISDADSFKATCSEHKLCYCWLNCNGRRDEGITGLIAWLGSSNVSADKHAQMAIDLKVKFGMKVRPLK